MRILKKTLSLSVTALGVLLISGFLSLKPIAQTPAMAQFASSCKDIKLITAGAPTNPVLSVGGSGRPAGVADSGQLDFDAPDSSIGTNYQACMQEMAKDWAPGDLSTGLGLNGRLIQGWTWNTNLGYVSFSCKGGTNAGANCGSTNYGTILDPATSPGGYKLQGFAWGDNIGWISMNCEGTKNLGVSCGGVDYGVKVAKSAGTIGAGCPGSLNRGDLYGYAWANSVGWMNFCGAHIDIGPEISVRTQYVPSTGGDVYANGSDNYKIVIQILENGTPIETIGGHTASATVTWSDLPKIDQVGCTTGCGTIAPPSTTITSWGTAGSFTGLVSTPITSIAPAGGDYDLMISDIDVVVDGVHYYPGVNNYDFKPAVEINVSAFTPIIDSPAEFQLTKVKHEGTALPVDNFIRVASQLYDCTNDYDFVFGDTASTPPTLTAAFPNIEKSGICSSGSAPYIKDVDNTAKLSDFDGGGTLTKNIYTTGSSTAFTTPNAAIIQTIVHYTTTTGRWVKYFAGKSQSNVTNQAADIRGNVNIDIRDTNGLPAEGRISQSIGERAQSTRELFYRAIKNTLTKVTENFAAGVNSKKLTTLPASASGKISYYKRNPAIPSPCTIIIGDEGAVGNLSFTGNSILVTQGCDIFIDQNIIAPAGRLGIIALEDMALSGARKGGNIYICSRVTDVEANFVADGSLMSYGVSTTSCGGEDKSARINAAGEPTISSRDLLEVLRNQLMIVGSLISNNTYGGSTQTQATLGDGTATTNRLKARWYDINFLRYAKTAPNSDPMPLWELCWASDVQKSQLILHSAECNFNNPETRGIINIEYRAFDPRMPIFNRVK